MTGPIFNIKGSVGEIRTSPYTSRELNALRFALERVQMELRVLAEGSIHPKHEAAYKRDLSATVKQLTGLVNEMKAAGENNSENLSSGTSHLEHS